MSIFQGFIGGAYLSQSANVDAQRCINWYPEVVESGKGKTVAALYPTPGYSVFADIGEGPVLALFKTSGRCFAVGGSKFAEIGPNGTVIQRGAVASDGRAASIDSNGRQLFITGGRIGYIYDLATDVLTRIDSDGFHATAGGVYADGYFVSLDPDSQDFRISSLYDGTTWDQLDFAAAEADPDDTRSLLRDHRLLWFFGDESTQVYYNSGNADFPWTPVPEGFMEVGIAAPQSAAKLDNSTFWLGGSSRGGRIVYRAVGYNPQRISTHAIETAIAGYRTVNDAVGYAYEDHGHAFYVLSFPGVTTWVYDVASGLWHERAWYDVTTGAFKAHRGRCHVYAYDQHLIGDRENGKVYSLSTTTYSDAGDTIRRLRACPHLSVEQLWIFFHKLQIDLESGVGLQTGQGQDPQIVLQWSDQGGREGTWSNERQISIGRAGQFKFRAIFQRMSRSRDRVFRVIVTDPVNSSLIGAYLRTTQGTR